MFITKKRLILVCEQKIIFLNNFMNIIWLNLIKDNAILFRFIQNFNLDIRLP